MSTTRSILTASLVAAIVGAAGTAQAALTGLWEFESGLSASVGTDLVLVGADAAIAGSGNGSDNGGVAIGEGSYYEVRHGAAGNGGGSGDYVNEYSILWDMKIPQASEGSWMTLWQTATGNNNDGDLFIRPASRTIGVADMAYSTLAMDLERWYRVVLTVDNGTSSKLYVDGVEWMDGGSQIIDDRFSLDTPTSASGNPYFLAFADNDGDDALAHVSNLAVWDESLDASAVSALGGAGREIAIPEPSSLVLASLGLLALRGRRQ